MSARTESNDEEVQDIVKVYDLDVDWPIKTVGITGLKANFGRDDGIEERYWDPLSLRILVKLQCFIWLFFSSQQLFDA